MPKVTITKKQILIKEKYNGVEPLCKCGCGEKTRYEPNKKDFCLYKSGHHSRIPGHWGDLKSEKRVTAISKTRKSKFASGEYDHIIKNVSENRSQETISRIKQTKKDKPYKFSDESKRAMSLFRKTFRHSEKTKEKMSNSAIANIVKTGKVKRSNLEIMFEGILKGLNIKYTPSYYIKEIKKIYDFHLPDYNILIEVDGDFWHCNPDTHHNPVCKTQEKNIKNDKIKNDWASNNNITLLRFWENDINNNIKQVKETLLEHCK